LALVLSVVAVSTAGAQNPGQVDPEQLKEAIAAGTKYLQEGEFEKAIAAYSSVIRATKNQSLLYGTLLPTAQLGRANALVQIEEYEAAIADYKQVLTADSEYLPALVGRGKAYLEMEYADAALPDFQKAYEQDRNQPDVLFGLGKSYVMLGGWPQGLKVLTKYVEINPENAEAYTLLAQAQTGMGKHEEALASIQRSLELEPNDHQTYFVAGTIFLRMEDYQNAVGAFAEALKRYVPPGDTPTPYVQGYLALAAAFNALGDAVEEEDIKRKAYMGTIATCDALLNEIGPPPANPAVRAATNYSRGVAQRMLLEYGNAIESFSEAITANPELADAYFRRGICYHYIDEDKMAIADFEQAALLGFDDPRARLWEGFSFAKLGDYHEAIRAYGESIAASDRYVPAYVNRGLAYMTQGEYDKAIRDLNDAIRIEPTNSDHFFKRGIAYSLSDQHQRAADSFAAAIKFNKDFKPAYLHLADELDRLDQRELAEEYRQQADSLESKDKEAVVEADSSS
jgi:tetratricopeptide (TPR) repeat protein